ncbi:MAG TPA: hypothetical protein PLP19_03955 [bacterium]|nr:hypothetical protein [bacterium]HPN42622.1 hypothetical protein [bacterium]
MKKSVLLAIFFTSLLLCAGCHKHINDPMKGNGAFELSGILFCNHHPLVGAQVSIAENDKFTATSTDSGTFVMHDLPQGNYTLQIDKTFNDNAFLQVTHTITIKDDLALDTLYLPLAPRLYQVAENRQNSVSLRWNKTDAPDFKSYRLYRHNSDTITDETGELIYTGNAITDTTFQDTTLQSATTYYYRLYTFTTPGKSGGSNVLSATTKEPEPPLIFFGNKNSNDYINDFKATSDGGIIIAGTTRGLYNAWYVKLDANMHVQWNKFLDKESAFNSVIQSVDGGFNFTGSVGEDLLVLKTDAAGNTEWEKSYDFGMHDCGNDILQINNGNYYLVGYSEIKTNYDRSRLRATMLILNNSGDLVLQKFIANPPGYNEDYKSRCLKIITANDGGFIVLLNTSIFTYQLFFTKIDETGNVLDQKFIIHEWPKGYIYPTPDRNGYMLIGEFNNQGIAPQLYFAKIDNSGNKQWEKLYAEGKGYSGYLLPDGSCLGVGYYNYRVPPIYNELNIPRIIHLDTDGNLISDFKLTGYDNPKSPGYYFIGKGILKYDDEHYILIGEKGNPINNSIDGFATIRPWSELE